MFERYRFKVCLILISFFSVLLGFQNCSDYNRAEHFEVSRNPSISNSNNFKSAASRDEIWIYVLSGQSNMVGRALTENITDRQILDIPDNIRVFEMGNEIHYFGSRIFRGERSFGPEVSMSRELARLYPNQKIVIFKYAVGNTQILEWCSLCQAKGPNGNLFDSGLHFERMVDSYENFTKNHPLFNGKKIRMKGFAWIQGSSDAIFDDISNPGNNGPTTYQNYLDRFTTFISQVRMEFGYTRQFVFSRIWHHRPTHLSAVQKSRVNNVRAAQAEAYRSVNRDPKSHYVQIINSDQAQMRSGDPWHFDATSQLHLGTCFAQSFYFGKSKRINYCND